MYSQEPLIQRSPYGGKLAYEEVPGAVTGQLNPENNVDVSVGQDRSMYVYAPRSGCPHPKQTQVLVVLRDSDSEESAEDMLETLGLAALSEEEHFILVFPNPQEGGWNYEMDQRRDDDSNFLVRCFAALPRSKSGVAGFNGMIYYIGTTPASSAMVMALASTSPLDAAAVMAGSLPEGYEVPAGTGAPVNAWIYGSDRNAVSFLESVDGPTSVDSLLSDAEIHRNGQNKNVCFVSDCRPLDSAVIRDAWNHLFAATRRWRNDTFGTYRRRIDFDAMGFVAHIDDHTLVDDGVGRDWFEYAPAGASQSGRPLPLVIYLHGINCCGTYGAEQSEWSRIAERDGFVAAFPTASVDNRWNVWDDSRLPSDVSYIMALIEHLEREYPIDSTRVYVSGFSMGSMFTNSLAAAYPDVFAGAIALNGPAMGIFDTLDEDLPGLLKMQRRSMLSALKPSEPGRSPIQARIAAMRSGKAPQMPFVQFVGLSDGVGFAPKQGFPVHEGDDGLWTKSISFWRDYNRAGSSELFDARSISGFGSDSLTKSGRCIDQAFYDDQGNDLYHFVAAERMPHAVDVQEIELGWSIVKKYVRNPDGTLSKRTLNLDQ